MWKLGGQLGHFGQAGMVHLTDYEKYAEQSALVAVWERWARR